MLNREGSSRVSFCGYCLATECGKQDSHKLLVHNLIASHFSCSTWSKTLWLPSLESYTASSVVGFYSTSDKLRPREVLQRSSSRSVSGSRLFPGKRRTRPKRFNSRHCVVRRKIPVGGRTSSSFGGTVDRFASFFVPVFIYLLGPGPQMEITVRDLCVHGGRSLETCLLPPYGPPCETGPGFRWSVLSACDTNMRARFHSPQSPLSRHRHWGCRGVYHVTASCRFPACLSFMPLAVIGSHQHPDIYVPYPVL